MIGEVTAAAKSPFETQYTEMAGIVTAHVLEMTEELKAASSTYGEHSAAVTGSVTAVVDALGKGTRGVYTLKGYELFGGNPYDEVAGQAAAIIEVIQGGYVLPIDDVADRSDRRRGQPAAHRRMGDYLMDLTSPENAEHLGQHLVVNEGLTMQHQVQARLMELELPPERLVLASLTLNRILALTGVGQRLDMLSAVRQGMTVADAREVALIKTSHYSVRLPLQLGAIMAGAPVERLDIFDQYADNSGLAYQITDDLLGLFGDPTVTGKPADSDVREGKRTMQHLLAVQAADEQQRRSLEAALGNPHLTLEQFEEYQRIVEVTGVRARMEETAADHAQQAQDSLAVLYENLHFPMRSIAFLGEMALRGARRAR